MPSLDFEREQLRFLTYYRQHQAALQAAFPECDDLSSDPRRGITSFTPHLSVGQARGGSSARCTSASSS